MVDLARLALPLLRLLPPETAHDLTLRALAGGLVRPGAEAPDPLLRTALWGRDFPNPIGLAAGFDKNAKVPDAMLALGFGFVEIGSVTPLPQEGNPQPRLFRLAEDGAVINRLGFNNEGLAAVAARLAARRRVVAGTGGIVGANIGKNRDASDAVADYVAGIAVFAPLADYLVANGADAYAKIRAGASLVQLYTGLIYQGPALIARIKRELAALLRRDGFASVSAAVGSGG